jgi:hypothetical protein
MRSAEEHAVQATASAVTKTIIPAKALRLHRYSILFATELALIFAEPFVAATSAGYTLFRVLASITFTAALYAVLGRGRLTIIAFVLGVPDIAINILRLFGYLGFLRTFSLVLGAVFLVFTTSVLVCTVISESAVTTETLIGGIAAYVLIGITFGFLYTLIEIFVPGSFRDMIQPARQVAPDALTYFSFTTLTTVSFGDIVPWGGHARVYAITESAIGILYPAVLIGKLVGLHGKRDANSEG